jgi:SAM-dependent MidA family methyltransferase
VTPLTTLLREEIGRSGPISFHQFMEAALYHPEYGYYRQPRDPFGKEGDFFTAEQLQPVFGILIAARIRMLYRAMGEPSDFTVVEIGPGRGEMVEQALPCSNKLTLVPLGADLASRLARRSLCLGGWAAGDRRNPRLRGTLLPGLSRPIER